MIGFVLDVSLNSEEHSRGAFLHNSHFDYLL